MKNPVDRGALGAYRPGVLEESDMSGATKHSTCSFSIWLHESQTLEFQNIMDLDRYKYMGNTLFCVYAAIVWSIWLTFSSGV